jgi:hypothetical protein
MTGAMAYAVSKRGVKHVGNAILPNSFIYFMDAPGILEAASKVFRKVRNADGDRVSLKFYHGQTNRISYVYVDGELIGYFVDRMC